MKKKYSLSSKIKFNEVLKKGKKINSKFFLISYEASTEFKLGISVPKKLGNSVFRNYNKRVVKNIISKINVYHIDKNIILLIRKPFIDLSFEQKKLILKEYFKKIDNNE